MSAFHDPAEPDWTREILIHLHASFPVWSMKRWSGGGVARCACRRRSRCGECCFPAVAPSLPCALQCWSKHQLLLFLGGRRQRWSVASPFPGQSALWTLTLRPLRWVKPALYAPVFCVLAPLYAWGALKCAFFSPRTWPWYAQRRTHDSNRLTCARSAVAVNHRCYPVETQKLWDKRAAASQVSPGASVWFSEAALWSSCSDLPFWHFCLSFVFIFGRWVFLFWLQLNQFQHVCQHISAVSWDFDAWLVPLRSD